MDTKPPLAASLNALRAASVALRKLGCDDLRKARPTREGGALLAATEALAPELERVLRELGADKFGPVSFTLGRADTIAKFFAFSFASLERQPLSLLNMRPFWGSGVYAIYYCGNDEPAYAPIIGTESPIYVGKADPKDAFADSLELQGRAIFKRLQEHARSIAKTKNLNPANFEYRAAIIQSGMQAAVEEFMIRLFRPVWNKGVGVCHGIGKHGDSATTRGNKRSPWDTMHPGRSWARATKANQVERDEIVRRIDKHFKDYPPVHDHAALMGQLSLGKNHANK